MSIISKIFGTKSEREVKKILPVIEKIEALDEKFSAMSEKELRGMTHVLKARLENGETLDDILPEAFATVREASWRVLEMKHFKVQLIGGLIIHQGRIAEMKTGEGKTLMATLPAYLNALTGKGVHIVTVNDYLARRDSEWMGKVYNYLGLSVGLIVHGLTQAQRKEAYAADITYGTNNEYGFDYLRDNMAINKENLVQRGHAFAIVDEVDSILIDEARTPLIISGEGDASTDMYAKADKFAAGLRAHVIKELDNKEQQDDIDGDYIVDEKKKTVVLTAEGVKKAEKYFGVDNLSDTDNITLSNHINLAIRARGSMKKDVDYVVKDGEVLIVDTFTGRIMLGRRFSNGLHQAIEAKENVKIKNESKTLATITFQNFFRLYGKLSGMTGTALTEEEEFQEIYKLDVVEIPTNRPMQRKDENDVVYRTVRGKYNAIVQQIKECHEKGQPVLVGTVSIEKSELLSSILKKNGIEHTVLNAKFHEKEAEIVAQAGKFGAVTISTNMAGRGTDIMLGGNAEYLAKNEMKKMGYEPEQINVATSYFETDNEEILSLRKTYSELYARFKEEIAPEAKKVQEAGGLYILGTERHESRRIDNQLRGRAGRQGDPGASRFFLSLEDDLLRLFGSEKIAGMVERLGLDEDTPIDATILSGTIENAQKRLESMNFERRKNVLLYDNVMNQQREGVYKKRASILSGDDVKELIDKWITEYVELGCESFLVGDTVEEWNLEGLRGYFYGILTDDNDFKYDEKEIHKVTEDKIIDELLNRARKKYAEKEELFADGHLREIERIVLLRNIDRHWIDHIDAMDDLEEGIGLRAWGQKDPVKEYQFEADNMFAQMNDAIKEETVKMLLQVMPASTVKHSATPRAMSESRKSIPQGPVPGGMTAAPTQRENVYGKAAKPEQENKTPYIKPASEKVGRNDPCPCGSGKKYKKCCGASSAEE
ncbi:MAG: preprotein translocase subunit SecA [Clostridia bacterium]|nr:preprotein translocase subunit SecA [Clostridia bacterium]